MPTKLTSKKMPSKKTAVRRPNRSKDIVRDKKLEGIVEENLPDFVGDVVNGAQLAGTLADTNAVGFGFDSAEIESAEYGSGGISFVAQVVTTGDHDEEKPFSGDEVTFTMTGIAINKGDFDNPDEDYREDRWVLKSGYKVTNVKTNAGKK